MRKVTMQLACLSSVFLYAEPDDTFSRARLEAFYDEFVYEEQLALFNAGINPNPPTPPPTPGTNPPQTVAGYFAIVISNQTGQPDSQVYFLGLPNANAGFFTLTNSFPGQMTVVPVTTSTFSASSQFSYPLSSLPKSTTGAHDYLIYVPYGNSDRLYFSIGSPLYFLSSAGSASISIGNNFYDPNYNVLYDFAEVTYQPFTPVGAGDIDWTVTIDTTQVDSLALPISLGFYSFSASNPTAKTPFIGTVGQPSTNPAGFSIARDTLINNIVSGLTANSAASTWGDLALPFYTNPYSPATPTTYLRVMAPKHGGNVTQPKPNYQLPVFPVSYLSNNGNGFSYIAAVFGAYGTTTPSLYIQTDAGGGSGEIYKGNVSGGIFTFVGQTHSSYTVTLDSMALTIQNMFSGTVPMTNTGSTPTKDIGILADYFSSAFVVGLLGVSGLYDSIGTPLSEANLLTHLPKNSGTLSPTYYTNNFSSPSTSLPGYDLYASLLHQNAILPASPPFTNPYPTLGLCYGYDFDDTLGFSSAITPPATTPTSTNVYSIITLSSVATVPTGVFDDSTPYGLTFTFTGTLGYRQGTSGSFASATSGTPIGSFTSTQSNPFQIQFNGNIYNVFPKYQFLQPVDAYTSVQNAVIQAVTFTPNSMSAPTAFTIAL